MYGTFTKNYSSAILELNTGKNFQLWFFMFLHKCTILFYNSAIIFAILSGIKEQYSVAYF